MSTKKEICFYGFILLDTGTKIPFDDLPECEFEWMWEMVNAEWQPEQHSYIYINDCCVLTDRIAGYHVNTYEN